MQIIKPPALDQPPHQTEEKKYLTPFYTFGVRFVGTCDDESIADCPFCYKEKHFYVNSTNGKYHCKKCDKSGSVETWLEEVYKERLAVTKQSSKLLDILSTKRNLPTRILQQFGVVHDTEKQFLVPVYVDGELHDLGRYNLADKKIKVKPVATRGLRIGNIDVLKDTSRFLQPVYVCEGVWDAMMLTWLFEKTNHKAVIVWIPGAKTWKTDWAAYFVDRTVAILYDNDHAADIGNSKTAKALKPITKSLKYVNWVTMLPNGYDISDFVYDQVMVEPSPEKWQMCLNKLFSLLRDKPARDIINVKDTEENKVYGYTPTLTELLKDYGDTIHTNSETDKLIKYILATIISVDIPGSDFVWSFIVGPPSSGKTLLLTSTMSSPRCHFESSLHSAALISGLVKKGIPDPSIIPKLNGRCLVLKDWTELLGKSEQERIEVQSVMRGAFDGEASRTYGSGAVRRYQSRFAFIAGVTRQIFAHSDAEVGERMLRYIIDPATIDLDKIQDSAIDSLMNEGNEKFIYLKDRVAAFLSQEWDFSYERIRDITPDWYKDQVKAVANLTAAVRTKVVRFESYERNAGEAIYEPEAEYSTRLTRQLMKLGFALAVLENKTIDEEIAKFVRRIAQDTIYGYQYSILKKILGSQKALSAEDIAPQLRLKKDTVANYLDDMLLLDLIVKKTAVGNKITFTPSQKIKELWSKTWL